MSQRGTVIVTDKNGLRGTIDTQSQSLDGHNREVLVRLDNGQRALVPVDELILQNDGSFHLPFSLAGSGEQRRIGVANSGGGGMTAGAAAALQEPETVVMPVIAEQLDVQKRKVETGGVRIRKIVHEREEIVDEPLMREEVHVKRVPIDRVVEGPIPVRHVGDTMIVSLLEEVLVVEKRLMLKEELHITKGAVETYKPQRFTLRTEEATVERIDADGQREGDESSQRESGRGAGAP